MTAHRPVRLPSAAVSALGVREWGIPTGHFVGAAWHRPSAGTVSCIVPGSRGTVVVQTRALRVVDDPANAWVPAHWRRAAARYCRDWPASAGSVAWWADLTDQGRRGLLRPVLQEYLRQLDEWTDWTTETLWNGTEARLAALSGGYPVAAR